MFCQNCGKQVDNNVEFCPECGYRVKGVSSSEIKAQARGFFSILFDSSFTDFITLKIVKFIFHNWPRAHRACYRCYNFQQLSGKHYNGTLYANPFACFLYFHGYDSQNLLRNSYCYL